MDVLGLSKIYKVRPSTLFGILDPYTAYCLDEACGYIYAKMNNQEDPEEPHFEKKYKSFADIYRDYH